MLVLSLISLAIGLVAIYISSKIAEEITQLTVALIALFFLLVSLIHTPWPIKLLILATLWATNKQTNILIPEHLELGKGQEIACPLVENARIVLGKLAEGEMGIICAQPCSSTLKKNRLQRLLHYLKISTSQPPTIACAPWIQVFPK